MNRLIGFFLMAIVCSCQLQAGVLNKLVGSFKKQCAPPPSIKILIEHDVNCIPLELTGKYSLYDPYLHSAISSRFIGKCRPLQALNDGIKWGEAFPRLYQLKVTPDEPSSLMIVNGKTYEGSLYIYDIGGTISIVHELSIESYITHYLAGFPDYYLHPEVLAAVAIAARTNAYFAACNPKTNYWAINANQASYAGQEGAPMEVAQAVYATRHMIMSQTGVYDKIATPFPAQFDHLPAMSDVKQPQIAKIDLKEANQMAQSGAHAAQILARAFPGATIMLIYQNN